ncbi:MAG: NAD(P)-binding protein, partial [Planctomycetota bacterium]
MNLHKKNTQQDWDRINRRDFAGICSAMGLACGGCGRDPGTEFQGTVIVVGAGAAGMTAGHLLAQRGVRFSILEAAPAHGGRIKTANDFVDFPVPLGGEWVHVAPDILSKIVNDDSIAVDTKLAAYEDDATYGTYDDGKVVTESLGAYPDLKFVHGTWLTFFEQYVLPGIKEFMRFRTEIVEINYSGEKIVLLDSEGERYSSDVGAFKRSSLSVWKRRHEFDACVLDHLRRHGDDDR